MFRYLLLLFIITAAVVFQTTLADLLAVGRVRPDFLLALAIYLALSFDLREVLVPIWGLGVFRDVFSLGPVGLYASIFIVVGLIVSYVRAYAFHDRTLVVIATVVLAVMLCEVSAAAALSIRYPLPTVGSILRHALLSGLYCSVVVLLLPRLLVRPCKWMGLGRARL